MCSEATCGGLRKVKGSRASALAAMRLRVLGKLGEFCNDASVPTITGREKVIGFRQLEYVIRRPGLFGKEVLPKTAGWVYLTDRRILMLDEGWVPQDGAQHKRYHEVPFEETVAVRHKVADRVFVDLKTAEGELTIACKPYGPAARLFDWLKKERELRVKRADGEMESPYAKERWYRHPPK